MYGEFLLFHILIKNVYCGCLYHFIEFMSFFYSFIGFLSNSFILESSCIYIIAVVITITIILLRLPKQNISLGGLNNRNLFLTNLEVGFFFRYSISVGQQIWFLLRPFPFPWKTATVLLSSHITFSLSTYNPGVSLSLSLLMNIPVILN